MLLDMQINNERAHRTPTIPAVSTNKVVCVIFRSHGAFLMLNGVMARSFLRLQVETSPPADKYRGFKSLISRRQIKKRLTERKADKRNDTRCFNELLRGGEVDVSQLKHIYCEFKMVPDNRSISQREIAWR